MGHFSAGAHCVVPRPQIACGTPCRSSAVLFHGSAGCHRFTAPIEGRHPQWPTLRAASGASVRLLDCQPCKSLKPGADNSAGHQSSIEFGCLQGTVSTARPPPVGAKKQPQGPTGKSMRLFKLHSNGLEPLTFGSVDRCSIQLSYECPDVGTKECTRFFRNGKQVPDLIASCLF
jgi:hypothetical protein